VVDVNRKEFYGWVNFHSTEHSVVAAGSLQARGIWQSIFAALDGTFFALPLD
jgi:hypothetical protein